MMKNRMIQWLVSDFILEKSKIQNFQKLNIDRTFMLTHTAPSCGEIFLGKTIEHAERGRWLSQCKGLVNITFSWLASIKTRPYSKFWLRRWYCMRSFQTKNLMKSLEILLFWNKVWNEPMHNVCLSGGIN